MDKNYKGGIKIKEKEIINCLPVKTKRTIIFQRPDNTAFEGMMQSFRHLTVSTFFTGFLYTLVSGRKCQILSLLRPPSPGVLPTSPVASGGIQARRTSQRPIASDWDTIQSEDNAQYRDNTIERRG